MKLLAIVFYIYFYGDGPMQVTNIDTPFQSQDACRNWIFDADRRGILKVPANQLLCQPVPTGPINITDPDAH